MHMLCGALRRPALVAMAAVFFVGCQGAVTRTGLDTENIMTLDITSKDIRTMSQNMSRDLIELPQIANATTPPKVAFLQMRHRLVSTTIDSYDLLSRIRKDLLRFSGGKVVFLDRERVEELQAERKLKRKGEVASGELKDLAGVDFFLTGRATERTQSTHGEREVYYRFSFRLTEAESGAIVWENDYEMKKYGKRGTAYR